MGIKIKKKKKFRKGQKNSGAIFEKEGVNMGWEEILKRGLSPNISRDDIRLLNYILRDGEFKTADAIMDEIYDLIQENKKMSSYVYNRTRAERTGRPLSNKFAQSKKVIQQYMAKSPDYEVRDTGNRTYNNLPIKEYRYIGE